MSILQSLARAYERIPNAPPPGFAVQKIGVVVGLNRDGTLATVSPKYIGEGRKRTAAPMPVPAPVKRTVAVLPNTFWDKTAYALGVTAGPGKRTAEEHQAFVDHHRELIGETEDAGLSAFLRFLDLWRPDMFEERFAEDMKDENVVFALEEERLRETYLHDRPAARALLERGGDDNADQLCLVSGLRAPVARLHPAIKGVWGGQSSGGSIVSFNLDAFESYGHSQGGNAPVSKSAAEAYTGALNHFLRQDSGHRVQIGDASTVFWAEADAPEAAAFAEEIFGAMFDRAAEDRAAAERVGDVLQKIREGKALRTVAPELGEGVRFYVLGLAPNAARISIRFWLAEDFGEIAKNYARFSEDMRIEPPDQRGTPALWQYLAETAVLGKRENVPPNLAGEWMRSILGGAPYPLTLLGTVLMRIRADGVVNARRASMLKAVLVRNFRLYKEVPVGLDPDNPDRAYQLGRLFAVLEAAQYAALGRVNATIGDRFYSAASATPARVFGPLLRGLKHHVSDAKKRNKGHWIEPRVTEIVAMLPPDLPRTLKLEEQGRFAVGYYHERARRTKDTGTEETSDDE
ncbi:type I-C CRISPR-associated protein Cas8c/Csd1 [Afifella pfennigii]|uniref:type I-C CRISPR-associated protein Cas8c/Csd1 n=1 Tax=Afifella pfennigii TaxID=209897 RepID=UPI00047C37C8|nr:type I-C CRISPR-associated protein Cas8c/Csd1 [Afifella pfennigii]